MIQRERLSRTAMLRRLVQTAFMYCRRAPHRRYCTLFSSNAICSRVHLRGAGESRDALLPRLGAIHFYTQWLERLGLEPISVFVGGLLMLALALGLWMFNKRFAAQSSGSVIGGMGTIGPTPHPLVATTITRAANAARETTSGIRSSLRAAPPVHDACTWKLPRLPPARPSAVRRSRSDYTPSRVARCGRPRP